MESPRLTLTEPILHDVSFTNAKSVKVAMVVSFLFGCAAILTWPPHRREGELTMSMPSELWATSIGRAGNKWVSSGMQSPSMALHPKMRLPVMPFERLSQPHREELREAICPIVARADAVYADAVFGASEEEDADALVAIADRIAEGDGKVLSCEPLPAPFERLRSFEGDKGTSCLLQVLRAYRANMRSGTASTKTRAEVRGGGKKPYAQKKTGRARIGSSRSPLKRGGGVIHGPKPKDWSQKINKKMKRLALERALFESVKAGEVELVDDYGVKTGKTREVAEFLKPRLPEDSPRKGPKILIVDKGFGELENRATRGLARTDTQKASDLNAFHVILSDKMFITKDGLESLYERLNC